MTTGREATEKHPMRFEILQIVHKILLKYATGGSNS